MAFSMRFSATRGEFVAVAGDDDLLGDVELQLYAVVLRHRRERVDDMGDEKPRSTGVSGRRCRCCSMRDSDSRSSTSRAMRCAWSRMMARKRSRASASSLGGAVQRLDEAEQRGERRAQLVAGVGDEIDAHALDAPRLGQIAQAHHGGVLIALEPQRSDMHLEPAFDRQALEPDDLFRLGAAQHAVRARRAHRASAGCAPAGHWGEGTAAPSAPSDWRRRCAPPNR